MEQPVQKTADVIGATAADIAKMLLAAYRTSAGVHAETVIGACAALAGEFALRASNNVLPEGKMWVIGGSADKLLFDLTDPNNPSMWAVIAGFSKKLGLRPEDLPQQMDIVRRNAQAIGKSPYPPLTIPSRNYPHEWSPMASPRFRGQVLAIGASHDASPVQLALALAYAVGLLAALSKDVLPPRIAVTLALEVMVGTSRMAPVQAEKPLERA